MKTLHIANTTRSRMPRGPFQAIKDDILGKKYELSLTFIGEARAKKLNQDHRNKSYTPNILSFPLTDSVGDIFICPRVAAKQASKHELTPSKYLLFLFIHGCVHLKGHDHGATMDKLEQKYAQKYGAI